MADNSKSQANLPYHLGAINLGKKNRKRPLDPTRFQRTHQLAPPKVYTINKSDFRRTVQQLTGNSSTLRLKKSRPPVLWTIGREPYQNPKPNPNPLTVQKQIANEPVSPNTSHQETSFLQSDFSPLTSVLPPVEPAPLISFSNSVLNLFVPGYGFMLAPSATLNFSYTHVPEAGRLEQLPESQLLLPPSSFSPSSPTGLLPSPSSRW